MTDYRLKMHAKCELKHCFVLFFSFIFLNAGYSPAGTRLCFAASLHVVGYDGHIFGAVYLLKMLCMMT